MRMHPLSLKKIDGAFCFDGTGFGQMGGTNPFVVATGCQRIKHRRDFYTISRWG